VDRADFGGSKVIMLQNCVLDSARSAQTTLTGFCDNGVE